MSSRCARNSTVQIVCFWLPLASILNWRVAMTSVHGISSLKSKFLILGTPCMWRLFLAFQYASSNHSMVRSKIIYSSDWKCVRGGGGVKTTLHILSKRFQYYSIICYLLEPGTLVSSADWRQRIPTNCNLGMMSTFQKEIVDKRCDAPATRCYLHTVKQQWPERL